MRRLTSIFLAFVLVGGSLRAAEDGASRDEKLDRLQAEARVIRLMEKAADDVKAERFEEALAKAQEAAQLVPENAVILNTKGAALVELRRFDEAGPVLARAVEADPKAFAPQFNQGEVLSLQGRHADALVHFVVLQSRFGPSPILKFKIYLSYLLSGQGEKAAEALRAMRLPEDGAAWYFAHAAQAGHDGRKADARRLVATAAAIHAEESATYRRTLEEHGFLK